MAADLLLSAAADPDLATPEIDHRHALVQVIAGHAGHAGRASLDGERPQERTRPFDFDPILKRSANEELAIVSFANQTAVITGGNSGIGLAAANELARREAKIDSSGRDEQSLAEARAAIGGAGQVHRQVQELGRKDLGATGSRNVTRGAERNGAERFLRVPIHVREWSLAQSRRPAPRRATPRKGVERS